MYRKSKLNYYQFHLGMNFYKRNKLQLIKGFYHTFQTGSMSEAAKKLNLTPSSISMQIQTLEKELKVKLFERVSKKIIPTEAAKKFYEKIIPYVQGIDTIFSDFANDLKKSKSKLISIGGNVSICYILPNYIKKFEEANPGVKFEILNLIKQDAIKRLINDEIDILVYSMTPQNLPQELDFIPLVTYPPILLTNQEHPLNQKKNITLKDIQGYELLRLDPQFITVPNFDEVVKSHGLKTKIEFEMANYEILKRFVRAGVGMAIVSKICLESEADKDLVARDLSEFFPSLTYGILIKKGNNPHPLLKSFMNLLQNAKLLDVQNKWSSKK